MKKKVVLLMLSIVTVLYMIGFVACSDDTEEPPVTITDPTLQEQYDAFCEFIENDTDKYTVSLSMEQAGEKVTEILSVASDRVYGKMTSEEYSQESYVWLNEDYAYTRTTYNNKTEHSVEYMPGHSFGIRTMLNELSKELLYTEDFLASLQDNIAVANDAIIFSFEDTQNGISCQNGTLTFAEDSVKINFDLLLLNLPVYDPSGAIVAVQIEINALGTNTLEFPFEPETEFAGITTLDRLYAQMVWVLDAESATLNIRMSSSSEEGNSETPFTLQLSGGEALAEIDIGGSATIAMGAIYKDNTFFYINETVAGTQSSMDVSTEEYGYTVARFFELLSFNLRTKECFMLADGSETLLTLSEQGKEWYNYCDELLIDFSKPSEYVISAKLNNPSMPENLICTIKDVGIEKEIEFPDSWKEYVAFYVDGIRYTDVSVSDAYEAEATSLEQYNSDLVIPENITVNGQAYSVVSLNSNFLNRYGYSLNTIVIPSTIVNMNGALSGSFNLDYLYYCGTQAAFEEVAGSTLPQGTIVYYYSEEQPQGEGNYWHWNEAHTAAERWPGGEEPAVQYQVYFDTNGNGYLDSSTVYASVIEEAPIPNSYDNMQSFAGWYTDPNCSDGNEVAFPYTVTENITLYAKWEEIPFIFELNEEETGYIVTDYIGDRFGESQSVIIPETYNGLPVTEIGYEAFYGKQDIVSISIPRTITRIEWGAFADCTGLTSVNISDLAAWCRISFDESNPLSYAQNLYLDNELVTDLVIPDGVTNIGHSAFAGCTSFTSVTIPNSVTSIGDGAFSGCGLLESVTIPSSVTSIGSWAFSHCASLESITIPSSVTSIGNSAFAHCTGLTNITIPEGVTSIGDEAFSDCSSLTNIIIPDSVTSIGSYAFSGCSSLTKVAIPNSVTSIGSLAFYHCTSLDSVVLGENSQLTNIGDSAFAGCTSLKSITIPVGVTSIGDGSFSGCDALTEIIYAAENAADGTYESEVFSNAGTLGSGITVLFTDTVKSIPAYLFYKNNWSDINIKSITIGSGVTRIGSSAFEGCAKLSEIIYKAENVADLNSYSDIFSNAGTPEGGITVTFTNSVKSIPAYLFARCSNIQNVTINNGVTYIGSSAFSGCSGLASISIPNSVTSIGNNAFSGCSGLASFSIPNSVTSIGDYAFSSCSGLTSISIPNSVTSIGDYAFSSCSGLTSISIPNSVTSIGDYAFSSCSGLTEIKYNAAEVTSLTYYSNVFSKAGTSGNGITVIFGDTVKSIPAYIFCVSNLSSSPKITAVMIGNNVTNIGSRAFAGCTGLTSITIPEGITSIGDEAFYNCTGLTEINYNAAEVTDLTSYSRAFYSAEALGESITVVFGDAVKSIPAYLFYNSNITRVTIGNNVTNIREHAFYNCTRLTEINYNAANVTNLTSYSRVFRNAGTLGEGITVIFGDTVKSIPDYLFYVSSSDKPNITSVTIGNNVTSIGIRAFAGCSGLTSITIPEGITSIGDYAFSGCTGLTEIKYNAAEVKDLTNGGVFYNAGTLGEGITVVFGDTVKSIPAYLFYNSNITSVPIGNNVTSIGKSAFADCSSLTSITIPKNITNIGDNAFGHCTGLTEIIYDVENLVDCSKYSGIFTRAGIKGEGITVTFTDTVQRIPAYLFYINTIDSSLNPNIKSVVIGSNVTSIGESAFDGCTDLSNVYIKDLSAWCKILFEEFYSNPLYYAENLYLNNELVTDLVIPDGVTSISDYAYVCFSGLRSVTFPDSLTSIGSNAFQNTNLTSITLLGNISSIGVLAFHNCKKLIEIYNCSSMEITAGNSNNGWIAYYAKHVYTGEEDSWFTDTDGYRFFYDGSKGYLVGYYGSDTDITLPNSFRAYNGAEITEYDIFSYAFKGRTSLTSIIIPDSVTSIGEEAFCGCNLIKGITIPGSVTSIGDSAFSDCSSMTSIEIRDGVTSIADWAFDRCTSLTSITIPNSVTSIGKHAFNGCTGLIEKENSIDYVSGWAISCDDSVTEVTLRKGTRGIADEAFRGTALTSIIIPDTVTSIGNSAFAYCAELTSVVIPDSVTSIGSYAFNDCVSLMNVTIGDGVTNIGSYAFRDCTLLESVTFGENSQLTSISSYAFFDCISLTSIIIPNSVTTIGDSAFYGCYKLIEVYNLSGLPITAGSRDHGYVGYYAESVYTDKTTPSKQSVTEDGFVFYTDGDIRYLTGYVGMESKITLPSDCNGGAYAIYAYAFYENKSLTSVTIPNSVTNIGEYAFGACTSLTSIIIPDKVSSIGYSAFWSCSSLAHIYYTGTAEEWSAIDIGSNNTPLTSANVYYYSDNLTDEQKADGNNYWYYVDGVPTIWIKETT